MDRSNPFDQISAGDEVIAADGEAVGTVAAVHPRYLLVEKGVLFLTDFHIPDSAIAQYDVDAGKVHLNVSVEQARSSGWDQETFDPEDAPVDTLLTGAASIPDTGEVIAMHEPDEEPMPE